MTTLSMLSTITSQQREDPSGSCSTVLAGVTCGGGGGGSGRDHHQYQHKMMTDVVARPPKLLYDNPVQEYDEWCPPSRITEEEVHVPVSAALQPSMTSSSSSSSSNGRCKAGAAAAVSGMSRTQTLQSLLSVSTAASSSSSSSSNESSTFTMHQQKHQTGSQHQERPKRNRPQRHQTSFHELVSSASASVATTQSTTTACSRTIFSLPSVTTIKSSIRSDFTTFGMDLRRYTSGDPTVPIIDRGMRNVLEPHIRKARSMRERARLQHDRHQLYISPSATSSSITSSSSTTMSRTIVHDSIASSVGVPYVRLRTERPFLYDVYTHPLHDVLAETLGVQDLCQLHNAGRGTLAQSSEEGGDSPTLDDCGDPFEEIMARLTTRTLSRKFQESYDNFVTSFCIPLLHSLAMKENLFHSINFSTSSSNLHTSSLPSSARVNYRYQAFPSLRIVRPGDASHGPVCDTALGHSVGYLHFHVPLTPSFGTNALYTESFPGKEDWHPLTAKSVGLGYVFDGARCIHFNMENTTDSTLVALDFVIAMYSDDSSPFDDDITRTGFFRAASGDELCHRRLLEDHYSLAGPGFYDEAVIDVGLNGKSWQIVAKKRGGRLLDPDERVGFPFESGIVD